VEGEALVLVEPEEGEEPGLQVLRSSS